MPLTERPDHGVKQLRPDHVSATETAGTGSDVISRGRLTLGIGAGFFEDATARDAHPADGRGGAADREDVDRTADDFSRPVLPRRGRDPRAEAIPEAAPAGADRRRRRAADAPGGRPPGRSLQLRRSRSDRGEAQARDLAPPL